MDRCEWDGALFGSSAGWRGGKPLQTESAPAAATPSSDNWRERERISRQNRERQAQAERRLAAAEAAQKSNQRPFNPSNRSSKPMSDDELCTRDRQQIEFAEKTKNLAILPLGHSRRRSGRSHPREANHARRVQKGAGADMKKIAAFLR
jgi:hypothetical protein